MQIVHLLAIFHHLIERSLLWIIATLAPQITAPHVDLTLAVYANCMVVTAGSLYNELVLLVLVLVLRSLRGKLDLHEVLLNQKMFVVGRLVAELAMLIASTRVQLA